MKPAAGERSRPQFSVLISSQEPPRVIKPMMSTSSQVVGPHMAPLPVLDVVLLLVVVVVVVVVVLAVVDVVVALLDSPPLPPEPEVLVLVSWFSRSLPQPGANQNAAETRPICSAITKVLASTVSLVARVKGGTVRR